ncbi:glycosyltransferase family 2 protein [Gracilibacillus sp. YIM 98692]|uniref:glycosyltransferase family 2 protein n=1 Tax=Gracilibacillus sp. YIM 98692 TaxID=2663532 RepID=UPI0013D2C243|nr:glycosyltransferase family 2 protein [Gracilibacillus sp. YIM 98692]
MGSDEFKYKITVFTPTYNRENKIMKLYDSLKAQSNKSFEWIVIDDGSTDNTEMLLRQWSDISNGFPIKYEETKNGGKHRAINKGLELSQGELFFIVDSDDLLVDDAIDIIIKWYDSVKNKNDFAGVAGLKGYTKHKMVGKTFNGEHLDATSLERSKHNILGDKAEIFKTSLLKKFKFPEIENEKFITESLVWYRIANKGYKLRWFNQIIYICDYLEDGLTRNIDKLYIDNFEGYTFFLKEILKYNDLPRGRKIKIVSAYIYRGKKKGRSLRQISKNIDKNILFVLFLFVISSIYKLIIRGKN